MGQSSVMYCFVYFYIPALLLAEMRYKHCLTPAITLQQRIEKKYRKKTNKTEQVLFIISHNTMNKVNSYT